MSDIRTKESRRTRRPWKVFVFEIGPTFSFADEQRAHERAQSLVSGTYDGGSAYGRVAVWNGDEWKPSAWYRTLYRHDAEPVRQRFDLDALPERGPWVDDGTLA